MSAMIGARRKRRIQHTLRAYSDGPPEEFRSYYAHAADRGRHRILPGDAVRFSFRPDESKGYGNPSTKRGIEFFVLPYYDERTRTMHEGVPGISLSKQTKDELREVLNMCLRQRIQVDGLTPELIASAELAPYYDKNDRKLECATCQGQHATDECRYSCHVCLTKGPRSTHDCMAMERFSNVSQNRGRVQVLYEPWTPGWDQDGTPRTHYIIRRRPYFRPCPEKWLEVFDAACGWFNGDIKLVDCNTYKEWRRRLESGKEVYGPFLIQAPPRMLGFLNIQFSLELLEKVYLKVVKARQMIRHECPNTTLKTRTYWTGQRDAETGEILVENLEETSEVFVRIEDFRPDDEPLHAELGCATPGSAYYIFPHGKFDRDEKGSAKLPGYTDKLVLKKRPQHPDGKRNELELIFDGTGKRFDLHSEFVLIDVGVSPFDVELFTYDYKSKTEEGEELWEKVTREEFLSRLASATKLTDALRTRLLQTFEVADDSMVFSVEDCKLYAAFDRLPLSYGFFMTLAYYVESTPIKVDLDVGLDNGLAELEWTISIYKGFQTYIEDPQSAAANGVREMFGPPGLGILRILCECFLGGPSTNETAQAVFKEQRQAPFDSATKLWPRSHTDEEKRKFLTTLLGFDPYAAQRTALTSMVLNRIFVLLGIPGSGKTELTCAAMLYRAFVFGERVLVLTETNVGANAMRDTLAKMLRIMETEYSAEMTTARKRMRDRVGPKGTYRWVTHSLAKNREFVEEETKVDRVSVTKGRALCKNSCIVVSTLGHARSKAVQLFEADTVVVDEAARSPAPRIISTLLERWLNTSRATTRIKPDEDEGGKKTPLWNPHAAQNLILVGDTAQGLPEMIVPPIMDKKVAWDVGELDNLMTYFMSCGAPFICLSRSFRMSYWGIQATLDRYYNNRLGTFKDRSTEVLAVKDAPAELVAQHRLPVIKGSWLHCKSLRELLGVNDWRRFCDATDNEDNVRLRHVILRTNPAEAGRRLSYANNIGSQVNWWHQELIRRVLTALFKDGEIVDPQTGKSDKVSAKDILVMAPYAGQVNQIKAKLREWFPARDDLRKLLVLTMAQIQGLQRPIVITDYTKDAPSEFLLGHHMDMYQTHHNTFYNVGLSRVQVAHFSLACFWPINCKVNEFSRRDGVVKTERHEESYLSWKTNRPANCKVTERFRMPGDRMVNKRLDPSKPAEPFVDPTNDNTWYFFAYAEKWHNGREWCSVDAFHWQRGVGCLPMPPPPGFRTVP